MRLAGLATQNTLTVTGDATYSRDGTGMTWFTDPVDGRVYLHSQFAEHVACLAYACFDQPDLKATFDISVKAPRGWVVVSNTTGAVDENGWWSFPSTPVMSTYVTAVVAGDYRSFHGEHRGVPLGLYCRESLADHLDADEIFTITQQGLDFFERRFGHAYPFTKYDQLFVPDFVSGAMENVACVTFSERMVFRSKVTETVRMGRAETILHEMAHMWFGNLVTMRWWGDLWLNESFAEYMGYFACAEATRFKSAWLEFASVVKADARAQDQLPTTHPVVADVPDVESIKLNLDAITYDKGACALRQLVAWVGEEAFFKGVEAYFTAHAYGNTDLRDFLQALESASGRDLGTWSKSWLEEAGVNTLEASIEIDGGGLVRTAAIVQSAPADHSTLRRHRLRVGLFDLESGALRLRTAIDVDVDGATTSLPQLTSKPEADLVLVNHDDLTYAKLKLDRRSLDTARRHLRLLDDPLARALVWGALWDMARDAELRAGDYVETSLANIDVETDVSTLETLIARLETAIGTFSAPSNRAALRETLARGAWRRVEAGQPGGDVQLVWAHAFIRAARQGEDLAVIRGALDGEATMPGVGLDFDVRWAALAALARAGLAGEEDIAAELKRDPTDEGRRRAAKARAARPLASAKEEAWRAVVLDANVSLLMKRETSYGFHHVDQKDLLERWVVPFFECLLPVWESHDSEEAISLITYMYPRAVLTQDVVELTGEALRGDVPAPLQRALLEAQDAVRRAVRAQAFDVA